MGTFVSLHGKLFGIDSETGVPQIGGSQVVTVTGSSVTLTKKDHAGRIVVLDRAGGIAVTLPDSTGTGDTYRLIVKTTFTGAATVKSSRGADIMIGHALMGNNEGNSVVDWPAVASSTFDTIDMLGTSNSTGGMAGQEMTFEDIGPNLWFVSMRGDASGTEASPFADSVT